MNNKNEIEDYSFFEVVLGLLLLILFIMIPIKGCQWLFSGSNLEGEFVYKPNSAASLSVKTIDADDSGIHFELNTRKQKFGYWTPWEFVKEMPASSSISDISDIILKNDDYTADISFFSEASTMSRTLIAKRQKDPDESRAVSYEVFMTIKKKKQKYIIENVHFQEALYEKTSFWDPFLGHLYKFSNTKYKREKNKTKYHPGNCIIIRSSIGYSNYIGFGGFIYHDIIDQLPEKLLANSPENLETIFRVKEDYTTRGQYSDKSKAYGSKLIIEVIDTRKQPFLLVETKSFYGKYAPPETKRRRGDYYAELPYEKATEYIKKLYHL